MTQLPPIALVVFSNDLDRLLQNVETERKVIEEALQSYDDSNRLKVVLRSSVSLEELFKLFNRYRGRIATFHFAGHAGGEGLQLNQGGVSSNETARAGGLAALFKREVTEGQLQFVFLNGCSTAPQVEALRAAGVPSVIATSCPINDRQALDFANQFYRSLANTDAISPFEDRITLKQAFETGADFLKTKYDVQPLGDTRGFGFKQPSGGTLSWELFTENETWTLPQTVIRPNMDSNVGNEWVESLRRALVKQKVRVGKQPTAVFACYGSLIEVFLQKMENKFSKNNPLSRFAFMTEAFQSSLRYLCYVQVAQILKMEKPPKKLELSNFFELNPDTERDFNYFDLLQVTTDLIPEDAAFMPEIHELLEEYYNGDDEANSAILFLQEYRSEFLKGKVQNDDALPSLLEEYLSALVLWLRKISFLAKYRMASVKDILIQYRLGTTKQFLHLYGELHGVYELGAGLDFDYSTYSTEDYFTYNHSVLLFNQNIIEAALDDLEAEEAAYLSLSPLVIDQSVFMERVTQTPEIYYFVGKKQQQYQFGLYRNEVVSEKSNKIISVGMQNTQHPKFDELFEQMDGLFKPFKSRR